MHRRAVLLGLFLLFTCVLLCVQGKYNFAIVAADHYDPTALQDIARNLTTFYASTINPVPILLPDIQNITLANLTGFDAILVWSADNTFLDRAALGNALGDYIEAGGGVVAAVFVTSGWSTNLYFPLGKWENYLVMIPPPINAVGTFTNLDPRRLYWPEHPVMNGVHNLTAYWVPYAGVNITAGSYVLARYTTGSMLAAVKDNVGPRGVNRVDFGFWPPDPIYRAPAFIFYPEFLQLMYQALVYTITPNTYLVVNSSSCTVPNILATLNSTYTIPSNVAFTQSVAAGTTITGTVSVSITLTVPGSGTITRTCTFTCTPASSSSSEGSSSFHSHSWVASLMKDLQQLL